MIDSKMDMVYKHLIETLVALSKENTYLKQAIKEGLEDTYCAVCGKKIKNLSIQRMTRPVLWHSRDCYIAKPKKIIMLENKFGADIVDVLKETTRLCGNIKTHCQILDVSGPHLYEIVKKYTGEDHISFFAKHATGKRKEIYTKKVKKREQHRKSIKSTKKK